MDTQSAARELEQALSGSWWTETDGPYIYAYPGRGYGDDGPRVSAEVHQLEFGEGWNVEIAAGRAGFHSGVEQKVVSSISGVAQALRQAEQQYGR